MTHNTPDGTHERRLWCDVCQLSVKPPTDGTCPACDSELCGPEISSTERYHHDARLVSPSRRSPHRIPSPRRSVVDTRSSHIADSHAHRAGPHRVDTASPRPYRTCGPQGFIYCVRFLQCSFADWRMSFRYRPETGFRWSTILPLSRSAVVRRPKSNH